MAVELGQNMKSVTEIKRIFGSCSLLYETFTDEEIMEHLEEPATFIEGQLSSECLFAQMEATDESRREAYNKGVNDIIDRIKDAGFNDYSHWKNPCKSYEEDDDAS